MVNKNRAGFKKHMETLKEILQIMGVLAIPSLLWNIFQYRQKKKVNKLDAERELAKKQIEFGGMTERHNQEHRELNGKRREYEELFRGAILVTTTEDRNFEEEFRVLGEKQSREVRRISADITYYEKLCGRRPSLLGEWSRWDNLKWNVKQWWKKFQQKN